MAAAVCGALLVRELSSGLPVITLKTISHVSAYRKQHLKQRAVRLTEGGGDCRGPAAERFARG